MDAGLLNTCSSGLVAGLVHSGLQLLEESINVLKVVLGPCIGQLVASLSDCSSEAAADVMIAMAERFEQAASTEVSEATATLGLVVVTSVVTVAAGDGKWQRVSRANAMANVVIAVRVNSSTLDVAQEVIESLDGTTAGIHALNVGHSGVVWVVDRAVVAILAVSSWLSITVGIVHAISVLVRVHSRRVVAWVVAWVTW